MFGQGIIYCEWTYKWTSPEWFSPKPKAGKSEWKFSRFILNQTEILVFHPPMPYIVLDQEKQIGCGETFLSFPIPRFRLVRPPPHILIFTLIIASFCLPVCAKISAYWSPRWMICNWHWFAGCSLFLLTQPGMFRFTTMRRVFCRCIGIYSKLIISKFKFETIPDSSDSKGVAPPI